MTGWSALRARLSGLAPGCTAAAREAAVEAALAAGETARALAPVDTGRLRGSIAVEADARSASVTANCGYAAAVELGSPGRPARPFLLPAARGSRYFEIAAARAKGGLRR